MAIYALLGSARVLSVSSTTTLAILTGMESEKRSADAGYDQLLGRERTPPK